MTGVQTCALPISFKTSSGKEKKDFKKREGKESQSNQGVTCFECNGHGHFKKECPNYLKFEGQGVCHHSQ